MTDNATIIWQDPTKTPPKAGEEYLVWPRDQGAVGLFDAKWGWRQGGFPVDGITHYAELPSGPAKR